MEKFIAGLCLTEVVIIQELYHHFVQICVHLFHQIDFKIIDLGMGRQLISDKVTTDDVLGTKGYHAPEVLFDESYDLRADIFMLGITFCVTVSLIASVLTLDEILHRTLVST